MTCGSGGVEVQLDLLVVGSAGDDVDGGGDPVVEVHLPEVALVEPGEVAQVPDDLPDPPRPSLDRIVRRSRFSSSVGQVDPLGELAVAASSSGRCSARVRRPPGRVDQVAEQVPLSLEDGDVVGDERQRVVDLVGDPATSWPSAVSFSAWTSWLSARLSASCA